MAVPHCSILLRRKNGNRKSAAGNSFVDLAEQK
jgi:hypothetical protein